MLKETEWRSKIKEVKENGKEYYEMDVFVPIDKKSFDELNSEAKQREKEYLYYYMIESIYKAQFKVLHSQYIPESYSHALSIQKLKQWFMIFCLFGLRINHNRMKIKGSKYKWAKNFSLMILMGFALSGDYLKVEIRENILKNLDPEKHEDYFEWRSKFSY